ncbi:MAG: transglycosylase domain-containing protein [Bacteroidia bacterium]|nr:transglycosylase domain-containing protein [Bacteroidia bacterium]
MFNLSSKSKKNITLAAKVVGVFLLLVLISFFSFRTYFLNKAIEKVQAKLLNSYSVELKLASAEFVGISGVKLSKLQLIPQHGDTLLDLEEFSLSIHLLSAVFGDISIEKIALNNGYFQLSKKDGQRNYAAFLGSAKDSANAQTTVETESETETENREKNYAKVLFKLIKRVFSKIPDEVEIDRFMVKVIDEEIKIDFDFHELAFKSGAVQGRLELISAEKTQVWNLNGLAYPSDLRADLSISSADTGLLTIPYIEEKFKLRAGFNSARLLINRIEYSNDELQIDGLANVKSFTIEHPKISSKEVVLNEFNFDYLYKIGENYLSLDSTSKVLVNGVTVYPFIKFTNGPDTIYHLVLKTDVIPAQTFIDALPEGLFSHIKGMEASGSFAYRLDFLHNENKPDEMVFESSLLNKDFVIKKYGEANLGKMNQDFVYVPMENGKPMRGIYVGSANPYFTPLDQISPYLSNCVLTTEDPSFFYHRGFVTEAFRQSIAKNIRTGKFKRGASTISMQLMKNLFLSREKTMARKLEEIVLVYILENNRIVSKDRMYEVYLNIIEWGPNVYGIGEASRFYFQKSPDKLTLNESMFLATLVPSPKKFMWRFNKEGMLKDYLGRTFGYLTSKMLHRSLLVPEDTVGFTHQIKITGPARMYIVKNDSLANDSLLEKELELIRNGGAREEE